MLKFTFTINGRKATIFASCKTEAMIQANRTLLQGVRNFYAWNNEADPHKFYAMFGTWD